MSITKQKQNGYNLVTGARESQRGLTPLVLFSSHRVRNVVHLTSFNGVPDCQICHFLGLLILSVRRNLVKKMVILNLFKQVGHFQPCMSFNRKPFRFGSFWHFNPCQTLEMFILSDTGKTLCGGVFASFTQLKNAILTAEIIKTSIKASHVHSPFIFLLIGVYLRLPQP